MSSLDLIPASSVMVIVGKRPALAQGIIGIWGHPFSLEWDHHSLGRLSPEPIPLSSGADRLYTERRTIDL